jgi:hypothetical protein
MGERREGGFVDHRSLEVTGSELEVVSLTDGRSTSGKIRTLLSTMKHCRGALTISGVGNRRAGKLSVSNAGCVDATRFANSFDAVRGHH